MAGAWHAALRRGAAAEVRKNDPPWRFGNACPSPSQIGGSQERYYRNHGVRASAGPGNGGVDAEAQLVECARDRVMPTGNRMTKAVNSGSFDLLGRSPRSPVFGMNPPLRKVRQARHNLDIVLFSSKRTCHRSVVDADARELRRVVDRNQKDVGHR